MLDLYKQELESQGVFSGKVPDLVQQISDAIPNQLIPQRMKYTIAISELTLFASHFRRNILHWNGSSIPVNFIAFSLASSGEGKDSSVNAARKCFKSGYDTLYEVRKTRAEEMAIERATADGMDDPHTYAVYKDYYRDPEELFANVESSLKGLTGHFNHLDDEGIGAGFVYSGEVGSELETNKSMSELIRFLSEVYDEGNKDVKIIGNKDEQMRSIKNFPVSALLLGSQDNILFEPTTKIKFKKEFSTKLARRSLFNFNLDVIHIPSTGSVKGDIQRTIEIEEAAKQVRQVADATISSIVDYQLPHVGEHLTVDLDVRELFITYEMYNKALAETIPHQYTISKLVRKHLQWKSFKLAGAIAFFNKHNSITKSDYIEAISFVEMLDQDMIKFEQELVKEQYEVFADYMKHSSSSGEASISLHSLRKLGYIPTSGTAVSKMKELVTLATSYDRSGIYTTDDEYVHYKEIIKTDATGVSYLPLTGTKEQRKKQCDSGYEYLEEDFAYLGGVLYEDFAYSPFQFKNGVRSKANIIGGCKWICLDVDDSVITDKEAHFMLSDVNHHIARTSDLDNEFKFRIILELDAYVDVPDIQWKKFIESISSSIAITADPLPKSQIFFSYSGREVLSVTDASPIEVKDHLVIAANTEPASAKTVTKPQAKALLDDPTGTFRPAFEASGGEGSIKLIAAAKYAYELGATTDEIIELMHDINEFWDTPMSDKRLESTIISQIRRMV